ncbi:MAG: 1-deoxy-D-xylulose-5-phosphate reductoisomerase, partial [Pseudomonadota bacterium]
PIRVGPGANAISEAASMKTDWTMAAIVGLAGLQPVLDAIPATKTLAIANKEPLVAAGPLVLALAQKHGTRVLPVDSEHNAIFQVLENHNRAYISKLILTASGGPFRTWSRADMEYATPAQAITHPNWTMGAKISVDSATLMNKALEVIEAHYLFTMPADKIDVIVHPQSLIHSMVEYTDGSVLAQIGAPDMRTPIAYALAYPARMTTTGKTLDWTTLSTMSFEKPDLEKFPALRLAYDCLNASPAQTIALNAANEMAVAAFLKEQISFAAITAHVEKIVANTPSLTPSSLEDILSIDAQARSQPF